jgi:hypothetical protein
MTTMDPVKARVKNGRLVLDEPTDLPEGKEIELVPLDDVLTPDEEQGLIAALESLGAGSGVSHEAARERLLQRSRR